jgi:uncharacterized protein
MPVRNNSSGLIRSMKPVLNHGHYVFCSLNENQYADLNEAICTFREKEGLTVILPKEAADKQQLKYNYTASWITLNVHSSLDAVGLTAAVSKALADENISCNAVSAVHHDHIFVARKDEERAMRVLMDLQKRKSQG